MIKVAFSSSFKNALKKILKKRKAVEDLFWQKVDIFIKNPFEGSLKTHKLSGKLKNLWSFTITYNLRVLFYFEDNNSKAIFVDFGTHDEVY